MEKSRKTSVRVVSVLAATRNDHLQNTSLRALLTHKSARKDIIKLDIMSPRNNV
jgi:hypothetical protein